MNSHAHKSRYNRAVGREMGVVCYIAHLLPVRIAPWVIIPIGKIGRRHGTELIPHRTSVFYDLDMVCFLKALLHISDLPLYGSSKGIACHVAVRIHLRPENRRSRFTGLPAIQHKRQNLPCDFYQIQRLTAYLLALGHHHSAALIPLKLRFVPQKRASS